MSLSGNDIGEENTQDFIVMLNILLDKCSNLVEIDVSDCKIDLQNTSNFQLDTLVKKLFDKISTSKKNITLEIFIFELFN